MTHYSLESKTIKVESFQTAYVEGGDPSAQTVLLLHDGGFGTTGELCWGPVMERLAKKYHVVAPDLLGWGHSDKAVFLDRSPYAGRIAHLAAFTAALHLDAPVVVGASFGGSLAVRSVCVPGNPLSAVAVVSFSGSGGPYRLRLDDLAEYTPSLAEARRLTEMLVTSTEGLDEHIAARYENSLIPGHWESLMAPRLKNPSVERDIPVDPYEDQLRALTIPVLLVEGEHDTLLESGWAGKLAALNPLISERVTAYAHEPNIEDPEFAAAVIDEYVSSLEASHA